MIPTRISLLSDRKKEHLQNMVYVQFIKHTIETILILICIIAMILLAAEAVLNNHFSSLNNNVSVSARRVSDLNKQVQYINGSIARIEVLEKETILWTTRIETLFQAIPEGVSIQQFTLNEESGVYKISGNAQSREDLLLLKEKLETIEWVNTVDIPISQLTKKELVPFSITAMLVKKSERPN